LYAGLASLVKEYFMNRETSQTAGHKNKSACLDKIFAGSVKISRLIILKSLENGYYKPASSAIADRVRVVLVRQLARP
jgi:hypothetical protein